MNTLISDGGSYEISKKVTDLLRSLFVADYQSEPYHQHQNKAENQWGTAKRWVNKIMNSSGCPPSGRLLCLIYVCVLLNHMSSPPLDGLPPLQALTGQTPDISLLPTIESTLTNPLPTFLPLPMKRKVTGLVSLTMLVTNLPGKFSLMIPNTLSSDLLSEVPITPPLIFIMSCLQGRAIFLTPTLRLTKIHQTSLNRISCGVSQSVKTTHHTTLIVDDLIGRSFIVPSGQDSHNKTRATVTKKIEELDQDSSQQGRTHQISPQAQQPGRC